MTNMGWIMMSCGLSLAVRLDILAKDPRIAHMTQHLVRFLDIRHSLRQIILRLERAATPKRDKDDDPDAFTQLLRRARIIESWYLQQPGASSNSSPAPTTQAGVGAPPVIITPVPDLAITASSSLDVSSGGGLGEQVFAGVLGPDAMNHDFQDFSVAEFFSNDVQGMSFGPYFLPPPDPETYQRWE